LLSRRLLSQQFTFKNYAGWEPRELRIMPARDVRYATLELMAFRPDIIVTEADGSSIVLVAEVKTRAQNLETSVRQLKRYMAGMGCPVGVLVVPGRLWLYRDRYSGLSEDSIELVGEFDLHNVAGLGPDASRRSEIEFERSVQSWLEGLNTETGLRELDLELRRAVEWYIVPAISQGAVRAGHPRPALSA
jgi:hypothetical protein